MSKIGTFFRSLYLSGTNPSYYREILRAKLSFSIKYYIMLSLLLSILSTIVISAIVIPKLNTWSQKVQKNANAVYPNDLVISIKNGKLSTNRKEPIIVALPFENGEDVKNLVIDPAASISAMETYRAGVLINETSVSIAGDNDEIRTYPLKDSEDITLNKTEYTKIITVVQNILNALPSVLPALLLLLLTFFISTGLLLKIIFYSFLTYIVARLQNISLSYTRSFQLTIHAITPIILLQILETVFRIQIPIPFFFPILYIILLIIIIKELKKGKITQLVDPQLKK